MPAATTLRLGSAAGLLHKGMPPAEGYYWLRQPDGTTHPCYVPAKPVPLETKEAWASCYFWGPITPPDELRDAHRIYP